jgi:hypothetical protein
VRDSLTHISVFHSGNTERVRLSSQQYSDTLSVISPDVRIEKGIVDHKSLTGEIWVREYYNDSIMIGYIQFAGTYSKRELYFYANGAIFLEKRYENGELIYSDYRKRACFRITGDL